MKQLKSSVGDLREMFANNIGVRYIAEPFCSFDEVASAQDVQGFMSQADYDIVGVRHRGLVTGYARRKELIQGELGDFLKEFKSHELLPDSASLLEAFKVLQESGRVFVLSFGKVSGIITRGDLQKAPVRMWLFGLISLIEMQLLRIIRERFPDDGWRELLTDSRIKKAQKLLEKRRKSNEAIDLADCLQFCDKRNIIMETKEVREELGFSETTFGKLLEELEKLRNNLAHAQDVITANWPGIVDLASSAEELLKKCEEIGGAGKTDTAA